MVNFIEYFYHRYSLIPMVKVLNKMNYEWNYMKWHNLFIICLDYMLRTSIENGFKLTKERSRRYPAKTITDADYTDDIALLANAPTQAETLLHSLEGAAAGIGLHFNTLNMEYMCFNQTGDISTLNSCSLKLIDKFTYLGSSVTSTETDINTWLAKAWTAIDRLSVVWKSNLTNKMKRSFINDVLWTHGRAKSGQPARTYIQQLSVDTGCSPETLLHSLEGAAAGIGLHFNTLNMEYMCFNQTGDISTLNSCSLKLIDKFTYLGSSVTSTETDINTWLAKAWTAIDRLSVVWKSNLTNKMKRSFSQAAVM